MSIIKVQPVRSDGVYKKIMEAPFCKKNDIYRYEMMKPFEKKWACYNVPMKAVQPNGYDVIMASGMLGFLLPEKIDEKSAESIILLRDNQFWNNCQKSIERSLKCFTDTQDTAQGLFTYFAGGLIQNIPHHQQEYFVKRKLAAGDYIVCRIEAENFEDLVTDALNQGGKYLFGTWLPHHNLTTEPFSAEKYYRDLKDMACMEIWVKPLPLENKR